MKAIPGILNLLFKTATVIFLFLYLPSLFVYLVSPLQWWPMGLLSIGFPYLWMTIIVLAFAWLFLKPRAAIVLFVLMLAGLPVMHQVLPLSKASGFSVTRPAGTIRVMQWNCNGLQGYMPWAPELFSERFKAVEFIKTYNPDIICTQDFANNVQQDVRNNLALLRDTLGYKYINYTQHYTINTPHFHEGIGIAIFSKFPIADSGKLYYPFKKKPESIIWADIQTPLGRLRLVTTHLQSMHLSRQPNFRLEPDLYEDSAVILHGNTLEKLRYFQPFHVQQANFLRNFLDTCKPPLIFTADLNSVPSSYVYYIVKGNNLQDVFLEKGRGFGRTYHSLQPALRIDYIFHTPDILPEQSSCFPTTFSDHDPVIMDFRMNR